MVDFILKIPRNIILSVIFLYQATLSPDHGLFRARYPYGYCRHYPSCSQYAKQSVETYGVLKGLWKGFLRILRCNPWSQPKVDLV